MGFFFAFIAILCESVGKTIDKLNFSKNKITYRQLLLVTFFGMALLSLAFVVLTKQSWPRLTATSLGLTVLVVLFSFGGNVFDEMSLKADDLSLREPMVDFEPILAGLVGYALFPAQRKTIFLVAFVASAIIVYWGTHRRKLRKYQKKGMLYLLIGAVLYAFLPSIYQVLLKYVSPADITFIRSAGIFILLALFLPVRKISKLSASKITYSLTASIIYVTEAIVTLFVIQRLGVVVTMLLLMLGPFMRYWSSSFILKEKVRTGEMVSSFMLAILVLVSLRT